MNKYKSFFSSSSKHIYLTNRKKSKKLSSAPVEVKQFVDQEASEAKEYYMSCEEKDDDDIDDDNESKNPIPTKNYQKWNKIHLI